MNPQTCRERFSEKGEGTSIEILSISSVQFYPAPPPRSPKWHTLPSLLPFCLHNNTMRYVTLRVVVIPIVTQQVTK